MVADGEQYSSSLTLEEKERVYAALPVMDPKSAGALKEVFDEEREKMTVLFAEPSTHDQMIRLIAQTHRFDFLEIEKHLETLNTSLSERELALFELIELIHNGDSSGFISAFEEQFQVSSSLAGLVFAAAVELEPFTAAHAYLLRSSEDGQTSDIALDYLGELGSALVARGRYQGAKPVLLELIQTSHFQQGIPGDYRPMLDSTKQPMGAIKALYEDMIEALPKENETFRLKLLEALADFLIRNREYLEARKVASHLLSDGHESAFAYYVLSLIHI